MFFVIDKLDLHELSAPVQFQTQDGKDAYRILYLMNRTEPHQANLKQDYDFLQGNALEEKQQEELTKWVKQKIENTYIRLNDEYHDCQFYRDWQSVSL